MSAEFAKMFGPLVGRGSQAAVYAQGDYAVKLYREGYPKANVFSEAYIMANLERMNFPGPKIHEVLLVKGRYGLRMDRVKGKAMSESLRIDDAEICKKALHTLVDLQCRVQGYEQSKWAPDLKQRFYDDLMRNQRLSAELKEKLLTLLAKLPNGKALCHCDFHPANIFFDGEKYTIIDLLQISRGDPAADAACSYAAYSFINRDLAEYYLARYCAVSKIPATRVRRWLAVYAGTLLGQIPEEFTPLVHSFLGLVEKKT